MHNSGNQTGPPKIVPANLKTALAVVLSPLETLSPNMPTRTPASRLSLP